MRKVNNPEGVKNKRGTLLKEFLDPFFFIESFFLLKGEFPHEIKINPRLGEAL
jgi:hypothetical protein